MKIEEYKKLLEDDLNKHSPHSCEACRDKEFLMIISYFSITKNLKGLKTIENILNSYKVTDVDKDVCGNREIDLTKVPKSIREKVREHNSRPFVKRSVEKYNRKQQKDDDFNDDFKD